MHIYIFIYLLTIKVPKKIKDILELLDWKQTHYWIIYVSEEES